MAGHGRGETSCEATVYSVSYKTRCWMTFAEYSQFVDDTQGCEALQQWEVMVAAGATLRQRPPENPSLSNTGVTEIRIQLDMSPVVIDEETFFAARSVLEIYKTWLSTMVCV